MNYPVFSIIVPVYNTEHFIEACIDSLLQQTYSDFELLLIDDGSTDRSGKICDEYAGRDSRVRVFHEHNKGVSASRNKGMEVAKGRYINFVDSDDWVSTDYLQSYVDARKEFDYDVVFTELVRHYKGEERFVELPDCSAVCPEDLSKTVATLFNNGEFGYACNKSLKKEIIDRYQVRFDSRIPIHEDMIFMMDFCFNIQSIRLYPAPIYNYRIHFLSQSFNRNIAFSKYYLACMIGCDKSVILAQKMADFELNEAVKKYCLVRRQFTVINMYQVNKIPTRKERLEYLKLLHDRFYMDGYGKGIMKVGLNIKNILLVDLFFMTIFTLGQLFRSLKAKLR